GRGRELSGASSLRWLRGVASLPFRRRSPPGGLGISDGACNRRVGRRYSGHSPPKAFKLIFSQFAVLQHPIQGTLRERPKKSPRGSGPKALDETAKLCGRCVPVWTDD